MKLSSLFAKPQEVEIGGEKFPLWYCNAGLGFLEDYYDGKADKLIRRYLPELKDPNVKKATLKEVEALKARKWIDGVSLAHLFVNAGRTVSFAINDLITLVFAGLMHLDEGKRFPDREKFTEQIGRITPLRRDVLQLQVIIALTSVLMTEEQAERFDVLAEKLDDEGKKPENPESAGTSTGDSTGPSVSASTD